MTEYTYNARVGRHIPRNIHWRDSTNSAFNTTWKETLCSKYIGLSNISNTMHKFHSDQRTGKQDAFRYQTSNVAPCSTHQFLALRSVQIDFGFVLYAGFPPSGHVYAMKHSWLQSWRKDKDKTYKNMQLDVHSETKKKVAGIYIYIYVVQQDTQCGLNE